MEEISEGLIGDRRLFLKGKMISKGLIGDRSKFLKGKMSGRNS